ncbi:hypothetical protein DEO72_LG8g1972 [Vigna unguiculata]|uniref:Uncharacterized protein n=1 Tax=Vigna unguiculata TaxID=3917 RepID=A0A4D6MQX9_VIGUN|nr:hypothetical protein DEO72_LG8g1972 [Vigna unguiculata]
MAANAPPPSTPSLHQQTIQIPSQHDPPARNQSPRRNSTNVSARTCSSTHKCSSSNASHHDASSIADQNQRHHGTCT